jgi:hypothetical protein
LTKILQSVPLTAGAFVRPEYREAIPIVTPEVPIPGCALLKIDLLISGLPQVLTSPVGLKVIDAGNIP